MTQTVSIQQQRKRKISARQHHASPDRSQIVEQFVSDDSETNTSEFSLLMFIFRGVNDLHYSNEHSSTFSF